MKRGLFCALLFSLCATVLAAESPRDVTKIATNVAAMPIGFTWGPSPKVLLVGGGFAHDFKKLFDQADTATLKAVGCSVNYTEEAADTVRELPKVDAVVLSVNQSGWDLAAVRKALFKFADEGKGIVVLHPAVWFNYPTWPAFYLDLVGGSSRNHGQYGEFEVRVLNKSHPVTKNLPASFLVTDELYYFKPAPEGAMIEVLLQTSPAPKTGTRDEFPSAWIVKHPKARIVGIAIGHDENAHGLPAFQTLLQNAVKWVARKP